MSVFPSSAMGLPSSLKYDLPPSLPDSARAYSVNVAPDGITSVAFTGAVGGGSNLFAANSSGNFGSFTSQMVSFTLPSGMSQSVFLDTNSTTLSFTMQYTVATAGSATAASINLIGSAASFFDTLTIYSNNIPVETVNGYGLLQNFLIANSVSFSERTGGLSICMGCDSNSDAGIEIPYTTAATYRLNFTIPLLSIIGCNSPDKFLPIGSLNNVQLQLQTANIMPMVSYCTAVATQPVLNAFSLSEFTLNMKYVDVGDAASQLLAQTLVDGKWFIKAQTYTQSSVSIPNGSSGNQQLLLQIRNTSLKSIIHCFGVSQSAIPAVCPNGYFDAINPALTSRQLQIGGNFYPNKPINDCGRPSEGYPYLIQALTQGGSIVKSYGTTISREQYSTVIPSLPANSDMACVVPASGLRAAFAGSDSGLTQMSKYPNGAYYGYDLEKSSGILFQGVNSRSAPPFLNLFMAVASTSTILLNAWGISDVILQIDTVSKEIKAFI